MTWEIFFLKNHTQNVVEKLVPDPFAKMKIEIISEGLVSNIIKFVLFYIQVEFYQNILKLRFRPLAFILYKAFDRRKRDLDLISLPHFLHNFWRKIFSTIYFINCLNLIAWLSLLLEILGSMCNVIICVCDVMSFGTNPSFLIKPISDITKK